MSSSIESNLRHSNTSSALEGVSDEKLEWLTSSSLSIVVVGASGDLAKKKTFPSLLNLFADDLLPENTIIWGYARSKLSDEDLRDRLRPYLVKNNNEKTVDRFLNMVRYHGGESYGDLDAFEALSKDVTEFESNIDDSHSKHYNRLFYFAIPPNVFAETALAIKKTAMQDPTKGWTRLIVEKPFGRDLKSFEELNSTLSEHFTEDHLYRIGESFVVCGACMHCGCDLESMNQILADPMLLRPSFLFLQRPRVHPRPLSWKGDGPEPYRCPVLQYSL